MTRKWTFVTVILLPLAIAGCASERGPNVVVAGGSAFPVSLAGRWRADQQGWQFTFESDGQIASAVIGLGQVEIKPLGTTTAATQTGEQAVFTPGPWTVYYEPASRELTVRIVMDHVRVPMAGNVLEGSSTDIFVGPISPTTGLWQAQWTTFTRYRIRTAEGNSYDLSTDATYGETKSLTFERLTNGR